MAMASNGPNLPLILSLSDNFSESNEDLQKSFENLPSRPEWEIFCYYETQESPTAKWVCCYCSSAYSIRISMSLTFYSKRMV